MDFIAEVQSDSECQDNQEIMHVTQSEEAINTIEAAGGTMDTIDSEDVGGFIQEELDASIELAIPTETVASDSSSSPAVADDLLNGCSQETKVENELDAEMVSEDELPAPAQPTIDDAEDLSDEELPGPKRAELPADTEVVSEDEFPSSNKVKRKADESHEADNTTEDIDTPKKRAKTELDSKCHRHHHFETELFILNLIAEVNFQFSVFQISANSRQ